MFFKLAVNVIHKNRLENQTEFDCFARAYFYLACRLPRGELFEKFDEEAVVEPLEYAKHQTALLSRTQQLTKCIDFEALSKANEMFELMTGRSSGDAAPSDLPVAEAETDAFPCLLVMCGSGFGFSIVSSVSASI